MIGVIIVLQNRDDVRGWLEAISARRGDDGTGRALVAIGHQWHVVAILYLIALLVVWFANPDEALPFMLGDGADRHRHRGGVLVVSFISRFVSGGLKVPPDVQERLPLLEARLHAFVPRDDGGSLGVRRRRRRRGRPGLGTVRFPRWLGTEEGCRPPAPWCRRC